MEGGGRVEGGGRQGREAGGGRALVQYDLKF